jgi:uncharacterized protein YjbI with pentapeptide repeats
MPGLLLVVALGVPLPLGLLADGEWWGEEVLGRHVLLAEAANADWSEDGVLGRILLKYPVIASEVYDRFRHLDLSEQVLLAKPAKPELVNQFRKGDPEKVKEALEQIEPVQLRGRRLRGASFIYALLPRADLRDAQLQGAMLFGAQLPGAQLSKAQLQGVQGGALLSLALGAQLPGANLREAQLQGAVLFLAQLQGTVLLFAQLQGADLTEAQLQGADLRDANLQGAKLTAAELQGADLRRHAHSLNSETALVEVRGASWTPLTEERLAEMRDVLNKTIGDAHQRKEALERIERAGERAGKGGVPPPILESCLIDSDVTPELNCKEKWLPGQIDGFRSKLFPALEELACQSFWTTRGLVSQIDPRETTSGRFGLAGRFAALLHDPECEPLSSLSEVDKNQIRALAKRENEHRGQSRAGKPAGEVPASPTPPPAIAPATP